MKTLTAEGFLRNKGYSLFATSPFTEMLKEFADYHVRLALKEALESIPCLGSSSDIASYEEVEKEVLNSYPKEKIQ